MKKMSTEIDWKMDGDVYYFVNRGFDVDKAKQIIIDNPREIDHFDLAHLESELKRPAKNKINIMSSVCRWKEMDANPEKFDITIPVIFGHLKSAQNDDRFYYIIDGWHRAARVFEMGEKLMPAVVLTDEETDEIEEM
jgi:hypothetical protein